MKYTLFCIVLALVACNPLEYGHFAPPHRLREFEKIIYSGKTTPLHSGPVVNVIEFGADPTGTVDSREAIQRAIDYAMSLCGKVEMADGIQDCNGVVINLQGGGYIVSGTLKFPDFRGNWRLTSGTIRAQVGVFDPKSFILKFGGFEKCPNKQGSCIQGVGMSEVMLDASHQARGCIQINNVMGANMGPRNFFIGFNGTGIEINNGHETMLHESWLGEYYYSDDRKLVGTGTGIVINGNDHYIVDTIIYGGKIGAIINGEANVMKGFHTWNCETSYGGVGIIVNAGVTRMENCYLDFNDLIITKFYLQTIRDTFFLGNGRIVLRPKGEHKMEGFIIDNSIYGFGGDGDDTIKIDEKNGHITTVVNSRISNTIIQPGANNIVETEASDILHQNESTEWTIDFHKRLVFKHIEKMQWSFALDKEVFYRAYAIIEGTKVIVRTDVPISGTLHVSVDASKNP